MDCIILAPTEAQRRAWQWHLEDLGADWRCIPAAQAEHALNLLSGRYAELAVLCPCPETDTLLQALRTRPLLSPPYLLGDGFSAPDGLLTDVPALPDILRQWKQTGRLPELCALRLPQVTALARGMLRALEVPQRLRAWEFLQELIALTAVHPPLLTDLQHGLYPLIARKYGLSPGAVERRLRLCVESTWSHGSLAALERFFGSSVDPDRGKPTNREFLCRVQERVVLAAGRL